MTESTTSSYSMDPTLWLYTSLTSGSSHIITATSRMETILKANRIPFKALDLATDEKARMLWGRRAGKDESGRQRKIPGLVQMGMVIGDIVEVEDWNEYGELKQHIKIVPVPGAPVYPITKATKPNKLNKSEISCDVTKLESSNIKHIGDVKKEVDETNHETEQLSKKGIEIYASDLSPTSLALRQLGKEAAQKAKENKNLKNNPETKFFGVGKGEYQKQEVNSISDSKPEKLGVEDNIDCEKEEIIREKTELEKENQVIKNEFRKDQNINDLSPKYELFPRDVEPDLKKRFIHGASINGESVNTPQSEKKGPDSFSILEKAELINKEAGLRKTVDSSNKVGLEKKPLKDTVKRPAVILPPDSMCIHKIYNSAASNTSSFQSPNSCAWKNSIIQFASLEPPADRMESIQSPNSTAWKPASLDQRLSEVTLAEKISQVTRKTGAKR
ncbi:hypothetical protein EPUL_002412 [Erysiphe pulchra]|uniref:Glutaredoxin domain-containing protein n=1 Tax=Erysiphe pulchra TaxID=225359 RepID=A0A2S4PQP6_9PEZI|nr:hypothetical protein EPUL_002412 [Erysiphe pulchra]